MSNNYFTRCEANHFSTQVMLARASSYAKSVMNY